VSKRILSLDLGITSIGYSILEEKEYNKYSLIDYGVSMFDKATDEKGNSKKLLHSAVTSQKKLYDLRKGRKQKLANLFEEFALGNSNDFIEREKQNIYKNKWELRTKGIFERKLNIGEFFTVFYHIAKHRGYKSLDSGDLLEELCQELDIPFNTTKSIKKDDEKGKIKQALKTIEELRIKYPNKTVAQIIYELEIKKPNPTFRNHDNYNYMIRREYIEQEIENLVLIQKKFGLFANSFNSDDFIRKLKDIITWQNPSTNDLSLFGDCEYYKDYKVSHQYSIISDIFKMYQNVSNIIFNKNIKITKEQVNTIANDFFDKIKKGKNISEIKYKDIRDLLKLEDDIKIANKEDTYLDKKGKKVHHTIIKFHFLNNLSKYDNSFIIKNLADENGLKNLADIFETVTRTKNPKAIYKELKNKIDDKTIIELIKNKSGNSLKISSYAMLKFIPYFKQGFTIDEIKEKLNLTRCEDYSSFKKGIKYLHLNQFEKDDNLEINNHPVKYVVSAVLRVVKHLHNTYGAFDEIKVESTRELSQNDKTKKAIDKANKEFEKQKQDILNNKEYQKIAQHYGKNLNKYIRKMLLWQEQEFLDIYSGKTIGLEDIFESKVDIDHIIPQSIGGLYIKHNLVLVFRDTNLKKSNQLPLNFIQDKQSFINRVEYLFKNYKINWKKRKNLLATTLDETFKDTFESKSLRATSYIEALTAQILKRYYPFPNKEHQKNGIAVSHIQGRATSNMRKFLDIKTKTRDTNIHHSIDAILIGLINKSWLQKISNTFRQNFGIINEKARENIKKELPTIEGVEPKEIVKIIEDSYNIYSEDSVFYKDIFGKIKVVNFWVSKKPMVSKIHKDTIYSKKANGIFTVRENIINNFIALKATVTTSSVKFEESFKKNILDKLYLYKTNPKDMVCIAIQQRASEIKALLSSFEELDFKNKEEQSQAKTKLDNLIHSDIFDNNNKPIRKVKFYQTNLTGFDIRGGIATKEKTFIGFKANLENKKLKYERIDIANFNKIKKQNDNSFKTYKNDLVFFIYPNDSFKGGKIVSFLEDKKMGAFSNPRFPSAYKFQPLSFCKDKAKSGAKQHSINQATGIIKLNLDILGNIKSYSLIGDCKSEILDFIKDNIRK
jgi:CRISPR-associated endonuclease Csn1